uniref:Pco086002 n=1 Tax=Arundo donax TaxID=35708 RepID=A0A0A9E0X1_ARUDO
MHENTSAAAAPRNPKKGAVSSPLKVDAAMAGLGSLFV